MAKKKSAKKLPPFTAAQKINMAHEAGVPYTKDQAKRMLEEEGRSSRPTPPPARPAKSPKARTVKPTPKQKSLNFRGGKKQPTATPETSNRSKSAEGQKKPKPPESSLTTSTTQASSPADAAAQPAEPQEKPAESQDHGEAIEEARWGTKPGDKGEPVSERFKKPAEGEQRPDPTHSTSKTWSQMPQDTSTSPARSSLGTSSLVSVLREGLKPDQEDNAPHLIVEARAGTGKTTTLIEGLRRIKGMPTPGFVPSPQQAAVFEAMEISKGKVNSICFVAFNKSIADELKGRVPAGCQAMTMHSMGYAAVTKALGRQEPTSFADEDIILDLLSIGPKPPEEQEEALRLWFDKKKRNVVIIKAARELVSKCKMNLIDDTHPVSGVSQGEEDIVTRLWWAEQLDKLCGDYDIDLNGSREAVFALVPLALERSKHPRGKITFDDMIYLPVVLDLPLQKFDLLLVDEAQDLNRCQQELAKRAGKRLILCGDPRQTIYQFAGADAASMKRMEVELKSQGRGTSTGDRGCVVLPLTVTRRCGKAIVAEARKIVSDFEAHETNCTGMVSQAILNGAVRPYQQLAQEGDMVLCRVNSVLIAQCLRFIRSGRKAFIQGKDVGKGLVALVEKLQKGLGMSSINVAQLLGAADGWLVSERVKEEAKSRPDAAKIERKRDQHDCIAALCADLDATAPVSSVLAKLDALFSDKAQPGIRLSSIHKAKGLESKRVFLLPLPSKRKDLPPAWVRTWADDPEQEFNLLYVGITRAIEELVWVS